MAEFSVAKQGYWVSESGWFSERSAAYLASGRPVITQDTGFSQWLPKGLGLLSFNSPEEAVSAIENLKADYPRHCRSARELAEEYFDASAVLTALIERASA
jgi:glycosyltransferase involved in cell wall biosynthesis